MKYIIHFDIAAMMLTAMLLLIVLIRRTYPTKSCKFYKLLLFFNMISATADFLSAFFISSPESFPLWLNYIINIIYLCVHNLMPVVFFLYIIALVRKNNGTRFEQVYWKVSMLLVFVLTITSPFTKLVFYFDENLVYNHGPAIYFLYASAFSFMIYSLVLTVLHHEIFSIFQKVTNIVFLSLLMSAVVFQFFLPELLIESFVCAVALLMMNVALDNPATYFYQNTYCFNQNAFTTTVNGWLKQKTQFTILTFTFDDLAIFTKKYGDEVNEYMIRQTIKTCHSLFGPRRLYYLASGCFIVDVTGTDPEVAIEKISFHAGKNIFIRGKAVALKPHFCVFKSDDDAQMAVVDLVAAIETMLFESFNRTNQRVVYDSSEILATKHREAQIVHVLHDAIKNDGFEVYYQPIFDRESQSYISAEALVRLKTLPDFGYISPEIFIPIAERNGMILDIGEIVIEKVCRCWRNFDLKRFGIRYMEINLSMLQLLEPRSVSLIIELARRYGLSPSNINLEITETAGAQGEELDLVSGRIRTLCDQGFSFSLDDYGTGYSTASYIAEMPFDIVKIDKEILWKAMKDPKFDFILNNSITLIHKFGRKCVVEGVENREMVDYLTSLGCDYFQGYFYAKPMHDEDFVYFLKRSAKL